MMEKPDLQQMTRLVTGLVEVIRMQDHQQSLQPKIYQLQTGQQIPGIMCILINREMFTKTINQGTGNRGRTIRGRVNNQPTNSNSIARSSNATEARCGQTSHRPVHHQVQ
jgi:hypothetical protein